MKTNESPVLALNSGSSSLKFGVFVENHGDVQPLYRGEIGGIASNDGWTRIQSMDGTVVTQEIHHTATQSESIRELVKSLARLDLPPLAAIGHRVVHGGPLLREHQRLTPAVLQQLESAAEFAPLHVPIALSLIHEAESHYPGVPQFACFDTAFHRTLPEVASRFPLPEKFWISGICRYGFHGISCESILHALKPEVPPRVVIAHLGNGASITAVANGLSADTSMGFTPTGGVIMSTRTGDLDPGVLLHILRTTGATPEQLEQLLDHESGLLGISGISGDMREIHRAVENPRAQLAIEMFSRVAKKAIGSFAAVLGGLDLLVFTGGIGENDSIVRSKICEGLDFLGIALDPERNSQHQRQISNSESRVSVLIVPTDEEAQIARLVFLLSRKDIAPK